MAKYRIPIILAEKAITAAGTEVIPINLTEPISRIEIKFDMLNGSYTFSASPTANVTKIELLDGSDVLYSLTGYECQALNIYDRQCGGMNENCHLDGNDEISHFGLDFGRFLYDTMLALDPTKFDNLQLKITYALVTANADAVSGSIEVRGWVFDEKKITPSGFLMSKEIYAYTCGDSGTYEYIDFPLDYSIRKCLIRGFYTGTQPCDSISAFLIDEDTGTKVIMDWNCEAYFSFMIGNIWQPIFELFQAQVDATASPFWVTSTWYWKSMTLTNLNAAPTTWVDNTLTADQVYLDASGGQQIWGSCTGYLPHHCFEVPFGNPQVIDDWYDTEGKKQIRLRLTAGGNGTNGTAQVVLQQYRTY